MEHFFINIDVGLFRLLNTGIQNGVLDTLMPVVTNTVYWRPVYVVALLLLVWKGGVRGRWCAAALVVAVAVLDPLSTNLLKEPIGRLRPYDVLGSVNQLVASGSGAFPSNHALNNAAAAVVLSFFYKRRRWLWWSIAGIIALSRIYCGVHWPSDVAAGLFIGTLAGWGITKLVQWLWRSTSLPRPQLHSGQPPQS